MGELILLDYIANEGLRISREANSDPTLWAELRAAAETVGVAEFFPEGEQGVRGRWTTTSRSSRLGSPRST